MFIKEVVNRVKNYENLKIVVFDGKKELFFSWMEYLSSKNISYLLKIELEYLVSENCIDIFITLSGINKEFQQMTQSLVESLKEFYKSEYGDDVKFSINKSHIMKEVILDILHLKK